MPSTTAYGPQYAKDDTFKAAARLHQSRYRVEQLGITECRDYGNRLSTTAALDGKNFYPWPGILESVERRFGRGDKKLYWDMLASDHVPFNFFVPLRDLALCQRLTSSWTQDLVAGISRVEIEWAPAPNTDYLADNTSFDAYIEYVRADGSLGAVGIEVKYTEREYGWGKLERTRMLAADSAYHRVHGSACLYRENSLQELATPRLKQFWRNQLLGEAILQRGGLSRFTSMLLYPSANEHFVRTAAEYATLLRPDCARRFVAVTYEKFIAESRQLEATADAGRWLDYLQTRYIVTNPDAG